MSEQPGVVITGVSGRMGQMLVKAVLESEELVLAGALDRGGHPWIGQDLGSAMGRDPLGVVVSDDAAAALDNGQVVIDFTIPAASVEMAKMCAERGLVHVIGTTGFGESDLAAIREAARSTTIIRAGNMSLGVNLLVGLTRQVAAALGEEYDIEVLETHHSQKVDAPSGTALMLAEAAASGRGGRLEDLADRARDGVCGPRRKGAIGMNSVRGGDVVGEHDVMFMAQGERIALRHTASDRAVFAKGALRAAVWGLDQGAAEYDMLDVLGFREPRTSGC